jgi:hypothetical protein
MPNIASFARTTGPGLIGNGGFTRHPGWTIKLDDKLFV